MKIKKGNVAAIAIIVVIVLVTAGVVVWMFAKKSQIPTTKTIITQQSVTVPVAQIQEVTQPVSSNDVTQNQSFDKQKLQDAVFSAVDNTLKIKYNKTKDPGYLSWDKKVDITSMEKSLKAAKGKWWASDAWDWIAWQKGDGSWKVLLSFDGFNCKELLDVPSQYDEFFKSVIHPSFSKGMNSKDQYCY